MKSSNEVILDPLKRYRRCEIIGNGAFKIVYRAYDQEEGIEVAWNEIRLDKFNEAQSNQIKQEINILHQLDHPSILKIFTAWRDITRNVMIFITEFFSNGTISSYVSDVVRTPTRSVISKWCKQILSGLDYMHTHNPPVIHRDLKCDNIFIDASEGIVKIGDFGLSKALPNGAADSCLGTPAYTAPDVYTGNYTTKADIWSFGLCVLEIVTGETPYSECAGIGAILMKVTSGHMPAALAKVSDPVIADFITMCLLPPETRFSAAELLEHPLILEYEQPEIETKENEFDYLQNAEFSALMKKQEMELQSIKERMRDARRSLRQKIRSRRKQFGL